MVCGEEDATRLVVKHDLVVRVPRNVDDANRSSPTTSFSPGRIGTISSGKGRG